MKTPKIGFALLFFAIISPRLLAGPPHVFVLGWGDNNDAQEIGTPIPPYVVGVVTVSGGLASNPKAVAAGSYHSLVLLGDGSVAGWGANASGEAVGEKSKPPGGRVIIEGVELLNVKSIDACENYSLAVTWDGRVVGWGNVTVPPGLSNVVAVSAGASHSLALKADGTIVGWQAGLRPMGLSGGDNNSSKNSQERFINFSNGLVSEIGPSIASNVQYWRAAGLKLATPPFYSRLSNIVAISACRNTEGDDLALKSDGTVVEWTIRNRADRLAVPLGLSNVTAIASGGGHCLALKADGDVVAWGENSRGQATVPIGLSKVIGIAADGDSSMALKSNGSVVVWGAQIMKQTESAAGLCWVVAFAAAGRYCVAIQIKDTLPQTNTPSAVPK